MSDRYGSKLNTSGPATAMPQPQPTLLSMIEKFEEPISKIEQLGHRVGMIADVLFGPEPQEVSKQSDNLVGAPSLAVRLELRHNDLCDAVRQLERQLERIEGRTVQG